MTELKLENIKLYMLMYQFSNILTFLLTLNYLSWSLF